MSTTLGKLIKGAVYTQIIDGLYIAWGVPYSRRHNEQAWINDGVLCHIQSACLYYPYANTITESSVVSKRVKFKLRY